jgi:LPXTG-motif cell wall-anchored protein
MLFGWNDDWADADSDNMIDAGEATAASWDGLDGISGNADDAQPRVIIGGAAGEAAIGEELPETNREGDAFTYWLSIGALLTAGAGLMLRARKAA